MLLLKEREREELWKVVRTIILLLLIFLVNGCTNLNNTESISDGTEPNKIHQESQLDSSNETQEVPDTSLNSNEDKFVVVDSDRIDGWKKLTANVSLYEMTYYGDRRGSTQIEGNKTIEYSIHFPGSWALSDTVFVDSNNNKVAEITPVVLFKPGEETEYLDYQIPSEEANIKLLLKESISNEYEGTKLVLQVDTGYGVWYPHQYILSNGTHGFTIMRYSYSPIADEEEEKLFEEIVHSFRFK